MANTKSRDISLTELYSNLQTEFLSYYLRKKLYCKNFSENYSIVCDQKKEKIEKISAKNNLPSIFNDGSVKERFLSKFLNETGAPNFSYKDEDIKKKMSRWDKWYYFTKGTSVKFVNDGKTILGVIVANDKDSQIVTIKDEFNEEVDLHYSSITRLFPQDFFNF